MTLKSQDQLWCLLVCWVQCRTVIVVRHLDSKVHGANMGPTLGRQDPGGHHVGPVNLAIWACRPPDRTSTFQCYDCFVTKAIIKIIYSNPKMPMPNYQSCSILLKDYLQVSAQYVSHNCIIYISVRQCTVGCNFYDSSIFHIHNLVS